MTTQNTLKDVYITGVGAYLPGKKISNKEMESYLGLIAGKPSQHRRKILKSNGIKGRYYALDEQGNITHLNEQLAVAAIEAAVANRGLTIKDIDMLATGTTGGDLLIPGFASMVHGRMGGKPIEILSTAGVCVSGMAAMRAAANTIRTGDHNIAVACASERPSALLRGSRFQKESERTVDGNEADYFDADFLRWMLSDGAGAVVLESKPNPSALSLKIEWITITSYADKLPLCMYMGTSDPDQTAVENTWLNYPTAAAAEQDGLLVLRQNIKTLAEHIGSTVITEAYKLASQGKFNPAEINHILPHLSSYYFFDKYDDYLAKYGVTLPKDIWFTNLRDKGNTGAAAIYIMLEQAMQEGRFKAGEKILLMVPESGRFSVSYALLSCVGPEQKQQPKTQTTTTTQQPFTSKQNNLVQHLQRNEQTIQHAIERSPLSKELANASNPHSQWLGQELAFVWSDFEHMLDSTPIIARLNDGSFTIEDYQSLLKNLRQQVVDGARWIARAASSITVDLFPVRAAVLSHAVEEQADFKLLEQDYQSVGGNLADIQSQSKNIGSEAFSAFMFHRANQENPLDLLGAMFIIEGMGSNKANHWGATVQKTLKLEDNQVRFMLYHGENDDDHLSKLANLLSSPLITEDLAKQIVKTAKVVARLYVLQLEEINNF